jgi:pimeloyl-ACP methyl ester carboxylesterase
MAVTGVGLLAGLALANSLARRPSWERGARLGQLAVRRTHIGGLTMHARVSVDPVPRDRLPVILVHGLGMSSRYMIPLAKHLAPHIRVYAPDLPGFGLSGKPDHVLTVGELADALACLDAGRRGGARGLCRQLAWLRGAGRTGARSPGLCRTPRAARAHTGSGSTRHRPADRGLLRDRAIRALVARLGGSHRLRPWRGPTLRRDLAQHDRQQIGEKLPRVVQPTLVVWGTRDYIVPYAFVQRIAGLLPRGSLAVIPGAAHGINYSHPRAFAAVLLPFLLASQAVPAAADPNPAGRRRPRDRRRAAAPRCDGKG